MLCDSCKAILPSLETRRARVNFELHRLGLTYHKVIPWYHVDTILKKHGFNATSGLAEITLPSIRLREEVGEGKWLTFIATQMEVSANWEVVAYVN